MAAEPLPSSTVVVLRDRDAGLEVLLLQRAPRPRGDASGIGRGEGNAERKPGPWVFPGGKVDPGDDEHAMDEAPGARSAAVRETREESGLEIEPHALVPVSRWITPEIAPRRFDTWFFAAAVPEGAPVRVDGQEIVDHRWLTAEAALRAHSSGEVSLAPPTFVTVHWLVGLADVSAALSQLARSPFLTFHPRICPTDGGMYMLYPGDSGYEAADPSHPGPRHRIWSGPRGFEYQRDEG